MAAKSNGGSVFKRGNSWYHYVKILQDDGSTKYSKKGGFASAAEAEKSYKQYEADFKKECRAHQISSGVNADIGFKDYLIYWFEDVYSQRIENTTRMVGAYTLYDLILPHMEQDVKLRFVNVEYLDALLKLSAKATESAGNKCREFLNMAFKDAVAQGYIKNNPMPGTMPYRRKKPDVMILSKDKLRLLLAAASKSNWYLEVLLAVFCGLRKGEIGGLKFSDFDMDRETVSISRLEKKAYHTRTIDTRKTLTSEQVIVLLEASKGTPIHMQVLLNVLMGLRRSEINGVKYSDVDYVNRTLSVQRQLGKKLNGKKEDFVPKTFTKQEISLKTESSYRVLPIPDYVFEAILEQRKWYEKCRNRRKKEFQDLDYICCSSYGRPRSKSFHWKHYKKLLLDNGLPDIRWHDLRSTFCTLLLKNDFNPKAVSKLMGHAKEIITMDVYGDNQGIIADCVPEIADFMDDVLPEQKADDKFKEELLDIVADTSEYLVEAS